MRNDLETKRQSSRRPASTGEAVSSMKLAHAQGLKIPVSAVRFRPWARVSAVIAADAAPRALGVFAEYAELQSSRRPAWQVSL